MGSQNADYVDDRYPQSEVTGRIIAAAQEVHRQLGPGFREVFYQRALALELPAHDLHFSREVRIPLAYRGKAIGHMRVDFVVEDVVLEVKAKGEIEDVDVIQAVSYLKASGAEVGLLLNFGTKSLEVKRLLNH